MSTMTATRGTPVAPPPTQNTAPVHEYRCLFTREAHKKAKKWHDGSLRFHTFNRRVVVYDDGNHTVGDLHYRQEETFGEGVELTLESRVLVQVEQQIGQTETDISQVVHTRHDQGPERVKRIRLAATAPQQSQQSLKSLLGSSQRQGRARMPYQSPYEQRHAVVEEQIEPATKRRKVAVDKENLPPVISVQKPAAAPPRTFSETVVPGLAPRRTMPPPPMLPEMQEVMDLSSDEEVSKSVCRDKTPSMQLKPAVAKVVPSIQRDNAGRSVQPEPKNQQRKPTTANMKEKRTETTARNNNASIEEITNAGRPPRSNTNTNATDCSARSGKTLIRIVSSKPRRKLMYKALLSESRPHNPRRSAEETAVDTFISNRALASSLEPDTVAPRLERTSSRRGSVDDPIGVSSSPLFEPAEDATPPQQEPASSQDSLEIRLLQDVEDMRQSTDVMSVKASSPAASPIVKQRVSQWAASVTPLRRLMPPPPVKLEAPSNPGLLASPSPRTRPFRRVLSENDADLLDVGEATQQVMNELLQPRPSRSPSKLTRTTSDTTSMRQPPQIASVTSIDVVQPVAEAGETGPWTSTEAFLLFEWWPPGKQKPDYGQQPKYGIGFGGGRRDEISALGGITSARDMIRDVVNVL